MTKFAEAQAAACEWCANGEPARESSTPGGPFHWDATSKTWVPCTAPSLPEFAEAAATERDALKVELEHTLGVLESSNEAGRRRGAERNALRALLNTPEVEDFDKAVPLEAAHQILRWTAAHDAGKNPEDWFWLVGYLAGKALAAMKSGDADKAKHHCISTAAALRNWHAHIRSGESAMRPGIEEPKL